MTDILTLWAGAATIGCGALTYLWRSACIDRDEARSELAIEQNIAKALEGRVTTLRGDNLAMDARITRLLSDNDTLKRENGRLKAEKRAAKPKRGPDGKFVAKPKANV